MDAISYGRKLLVWNTEQYFIFTVYRGDMATYRGEMKRQQSEYKMNTISLVTQLYNTKEELTRVSMEKVREYVKRLDKRKLLKLKKLMLFSR